MMPAQKERPCWMLRALAGRINRLTSLAAARESTTIVDLVVGPFSESSLTSALLSAVDATSAAAGKSLTCVELAENPSAARLSPRSLRVTDASSEQ